jgi:Ca2+-binding EF-hand superfamily protein
MNAKTMALAALLAGATGTTHAAEGQSVRDMFRQLDTNGDRSLQFEEIAAARANLFDAMDANHDGIADPGELRKAAAEKADRNVQWERTAEFAAQRKRIDANGDGAIARQEFVAFIPERLLDADENGDRSLSLSEMRSLRRN